MARLARISSFKLRRALPYGAAAALIGVAVVLLVHAAGPLAAFEPEVGQLSGSAVATAVTGASGGNVLKFGTPIPTPTPARTTNCAPSPSACGFPDATNTGVPAGVTLTAYTGPTTITAAGTVIDGKLITSPIEVLATGVIIKNSRISVSVAGADPVVVDFDNRGGSLTIQDSELAGGQGGAINYSNWQGYRLNIHNFGGDGCKLGTNVTLKDSYIHDFTPVAEAHADACQMQDGSSNILVQHNTLVPGGTGHTALIISNDTGPDTATNVTIDGNLLVGGNYTVSLGDGHGVYLTHNLKFTNNRIINTTGYGPLDVADREVPYITAWSGNVNDATNEPLSLQ